MRPVAFAASNSGVDYASTSGTLTFTGSETQKTFTVDLCPDPISEDPAEIFNVTLDSPTNSTLASPSSSVVSILDSATEFRNDTVMLLEDGFPASVYPSIVTVSGYSGAVSGLRLTLSNVNRQTSADLFVLLVDPSGTRKMVIMAAVGGANPLSNATITLEDLAAAHLPSTSGIMNGQNYKPTNCAGGGFDFPGPAPVSPYNDPGCGGGPFSVDQLGTVEDTFASVFGGANPNGDWKLYVFDESLDGIVPGDAGSIGGWGIQFLLPTAEGVSVSGRVLTATGEGIRNATVTLMGGNLTAPLTVRTGRSDITISTICSRELRMSYLSAQGNL